MAATLIKESVKPNIVEKTNQTNFAPGFYVFEHLLFESNSAADLAACEDQLTV